MRTLTAFISRRLVASIAVGVALGLLFAVAGPMVVFGGLATIAIGVLAFTSPEMVVLALLCFASGLIPDRYNQSVDLLVGHLQVSDLMLIWLLLVVVIRALGERSFQFTRTPIDKPVALFFGAYSVGVLTAVLGSDLSFSDATYEARTMIYYLALFPIVNLVNTKERLVRLSKGILTIGLLLAILMLIETSLEAPALLGGGHSISRGSGSVRIYHPGYTTVYVALMGLLGRVALDDRQRSMHLNAVLALVLGSALFLTLGRNVLVSGALMIVFLATILRKPELTRLSQHFPIIALIVVMLASVITLADKQTWFLAQSREYVDRLSRMFSSDILSTSETLAFRLEELKFAWRQIAGHPLLGIGLNNPYRPPFYPGEPQGLSLYVHNGYISILLKTGLLGLLPFIWFSLNCVRGTLQHWRDIEHPLLRGTALGFALAYLGMMISNLVAPSFVEPGSLVIFGIVLGINESILAQNSNAGNLHGRTVPPPRPLIAGYRSYSAG